MRQYNEECGVFGVFGNSDTDVALTTYHGLYALQHRGQESCGIVICRDRSFNMHVDMGLVSEVFTKNVLASLGQGNMAVGHVRYSVTGSNTRQNAQPMVFKHLKGNLALAHNGNLTNAKELRQQLELSGAVFHTTSDTELIGYIIIQERLRSKSIEEAVTRAMAHFGGAYSLVIMSPQKLIAVRDPHGLRPLCFGKTPDGRYVIASESCALDAVGARLEREVDPGEVIVFSPDGVNYIRTHCGEAKPSLCIFEYIYFARPDSVIDEVHVHEARKKAGALLAIEHPVQADVVIGVPDSGIDAAIGYSHQSGIRYDIGLIKNKYIGRSFIVPQQSERENVVKLKLNVVADAVAGKRVVLVDDSIVRGTTMKQLIGMLREAGATEVHVRVSAPPFLNPCFYGTDIDSRRELIAYHATVPEIAQIIGADSLGYLELDHVTYIARGNSPGAGYCTACFSGNYPTKINDMQDKASLEKLTAST